MAKGQKFSKPARSVDHHLSLLRDRGVIVLEEDEIYVKNEIRSIGYFRLSGYFGPLQVSKDEFKKGTTFEDILRLYEFDRKLKFLLYELLEKFEIGLRTKMTDILSRSHNSFWYNQEELFKNSTTEIEVPDCTFDDEQKAIIQSKVIITRRYKLLLSDIKKSIELHKESQFMKAFYEKYDIDSPVPSWMMMEGISFGKLSKLYWLLASSEEKRIIATHFGALNSDFLTSWLHSLVVLRNACAHHGRLWNRKLGKDIKIPSRSSKKFIACTDNEKLRMFYGVASCLLKIFLSFNPEEGKRFKTEFFQLVKKHEIDYKAMGFPDNWNADDIWKV